VATHSEHRPLTLPARTGTLATLLQNRRSVRKYQARTVSRELIEQGFEVAVAKDATAGPKHPEWGYGYTAALINFAFLAHAVWTTNEAVKIMEEGLR